jgi:NAD(P)-dependent dehydrogenase (short-subunit alcohol dehydrogenase family)
LIDVTDGASIEAAAKQVREAVGEKGLAGLINNAGVVVSGPLEFVPLDELRQQIEINVIGQVAVTQAFLPLLRKRKGRIVNMGSIGGKIALPFVGPYAASKFALEAITDSFRRELRGTGIEVSILQPGGVATPIWAKGEAQADEQRRQMSEEAQALYGTAMDKMAETARKTGAAAIPPEEVAKVVEHALTAPKPKTRYLVGKEAKIQATLRKVLSDRALDGFLAKFIGL